MAEAAGAATSPEILSGHDVPHDVLTSVVYWMRKAGATNLAGELYRCRMTALKGAPYCVNEGCTVVGHLKDFKVCPQCKTARYCGDACQKVDWNAGGHKTLCGTFGHRTNFGV